MRIKTITAFLATALIFTSCVEQLNVPSFTDRITFGAKGLISVRTKATEVTTLNSFYVSAVTGSAGSEASAFNSVKFNKVPASDPAAYTSTQVWPASDPGYAFYASNIPLTYTSAGATVTATNATDVVCAYLPTSTYRYANTLSFEHIFARLGTVTVVAAPNTTVWDVSIRITPKTGGMYNLRTKEWSSVTTGSATQIANAIDANANDLWLVPGTYTLTASWTVRPWGGAAEQHTNSETEITVEKGKTTAVSCMLGSGIQVGINLERFENYDFYSRPTFAGLMICPAPLYYDGTKGFIIKDDDWNHHSWGGTQGKTNGSYRFSFLELGSYFDSRGASFTSSSGSINNLGGKVSYDGYDNWCLATTSDLKDIFSLYPTTRVGSTVNGKPNVVFKKIIVGDVPFAGFDGTYGILVFPDNCNIYGVSLADNVTRISNNSLNVYLSQGCVFLPTFGTIDANTQVGVYFILADSYADNECYTFLSHYQFSTGRVSFNLSCIDRAKTNYGPVFVVRREKSFSSISTPALYTVSQRYPGTDITMMSNWQSEYDLFYTMMKSMDFSRGDYIEVCCDLSRCVNPNENVADFGWDCDSWFPRSRSLVHIYFPRSEGGVTTRTLNIFFCRYNGSQTGRNISVADETNVTLRVDSSGLWVDGTLIDDGGIFASQYNSGTVSDFLFGSLEGATRSAALYKYAKVHFGS